MKILIVAILIVVVSTSIVFATAQIPDKIVYDGKEYSLHTNPMEPYFEKHPDKKPKGGVVSTALWRGYVATFEFRANRLFLKDINIEVSNKAANEKHDTFWKSVKADVVPQGGELFVEWFTGILVLPHGKLVHRVHMGYDSIYSDYILLEVKEGKLTGKRTLAHKQYEEFKETQFQAFKKTEDYKTQADKLRSEKWSQNDIDSFLRSYIVEYSSKFLDKEGNENESSSKAVDNDKK